ncbi:MazG nucleotide pyrophosphohydrolase domain-containing protein [Paenibacillus koleovorans]|uniref:MazG nucleotide pyrophosphohydrolase domain-containing protein n=1 Tax=Paenibacillus koleovorans TaxID=121608 RepID=UPI001FE9B1FF|nr:MazG nucleotide pyrophosphohydrolase domain-containing protein [Paenibacillus koleovorans]
MLQQGFSITELQAYIKNQDFRPDQPMHYFYKLIEEVGELSEVLRKNRRLNDEGTIKGTIEEELYDVLYYIAAIANIYEIDLEECAILKEQINVKKYAQTSNAQYKGESPCSQ